MQSWTDIVAQVGEPVGRQGDKEQRRGKAQGVERIVAGEVGRLVDAYRPGVIELTELKERPV